MPNDSSNINNHNNRPISADDVRFSLSRHDFHIPASDGELDTLQADEQLRQFVSPGAELPTELIEEQKAVLLKPGEVVADRFEVVKQLGFGGMGAVYQVNDRLTRQARALKVMLSSLLQSPRAQQRFVAEVTISQQLAHEGVVRVYDIGEDARRGICFFTMELIEGKTLNKLLKERGGSLPIEKALDLIRQLCRALEHAHNYTIHRDLKPQNIMVRADGSIKILDFGLAKLVSPGRMTRSSVALGTAYYQAPEQSIHLRELDQRADIYSIGVILYQMATGEIPVGRVKSPSELDPEIPVALDDVVLKCIEPTPSDRYETVTEFANALEKAWNAGNAHGADTPAGKDDEQHKEPIAKMEEVTTCEGNSLPWFAVEQGLFKTDEKRQEDEARRRALTRAQCRRAMRILLCMAAILSAGAGLTFLGIRYMRSSG
ncbi:MAG: serine/threonine-protein kinase, partial [Candidatus Hydrogenedentota bacterium]